MNVPVSLDLCFARQFFHLIVLSVVSSNTRAKIIIITTNPCEFHSALWILCTLNCMKKIKINSSCGAVTFSMRFYFCLLSYNFYLPHRIQLTSIISKNLFRIELNVAKRTDYIPKIIDFVLTTTNTRNTKNETQKLKEIIKNAQFEDTSNVRIWTYSTKKTGLLNWSESNELEFFFVIATLLLLSFDGCLLAWCWFSLVTHTLYRERGRCTHSQCNASASVVRRVYWGTEKWRIAIACVRRLCSKWTENSFLFSRAHSDKSDLLAVNSHREWWIHSDLTFRLVFSCCCCCCRWHC